MACAALTRIVSVDATVGEPFQNTAMSSVSSPGVSSAIFAAISPVVYICASPGASTSPACANVLPYPSSQRIIQSCSPLVSV